jgi:hypothetical protein
MAPAAAVRDFLMYGARAAMAGGLFHIEEQVKGIERAVIENPGFGIRPGQDGGRECLPYDSR